MRTGCDGRGCTPGRLDCWSLKNLSTAGADKTYEQGFMHVMEAGRAESRRHRPRRNATSPPTRTVLALREPEGSSAFAAALLAPSASAAARLSRHRRRQKYQPPSAARKGPTWRQRRQRCQASMSNVAQIAGVSTVPVKICRAGRSWVRFTSCAALTTAPYS